MLNNPTIDKLRHMRLNTMADDYLNPPPSAEALSFDERFGLLVEREYYAKRNAKIHRLQMQSGLDRGACLEDIEYGIGRSISKNQVATIGGCQFIEQKLNIIICGKTGTGKSYLASAIGNAACRRGYSCKYFRIPQLLAEIEIARLENKYLRLMESLRKIHLLVIDDIGLKSYSFEEARDLLEIAELRYNRTSTIFASQVPHGKWYELIPDPTIADAYMDRVVHNSYILSLDSKVSMREIEAQKKMKLLEMGGGD